MNALAIFVLLAESSAAQAKPASAALPARAAPASPAALAPPALVVPATRGAPTPWSLARTPAPGPAGAIGRPGAGCLQGAARLPLRGDGFRVLRPKRGRVYGHPDLVAVIRQLT